MKVVVLAGGKGERIGGEKPLKPFLGKPLAYWVFEIAKKVELPVYFSVKNKDQAQKITEALVALGVSQKDFTFIYDKNPKIEGPISGIWSGVSAFNEGSVLFLAVDQPLVELSFLKFLTSLSEIFCHGFVLLSQGQEKIKPFPGVYPVWLKDEIETFFTMSPKYSLFRFFNHLMNKGRVLILKDSLVNPKNFINLNTLEDLKEAERCFCQR
ncbi:molybdenum cofactor guanylyltransferase [Thermodesulfobacterium sp. TA1]|uniref:molybdenum cofactor guanylyltransferase n=1 Tax=Thermodesulfobacterium sp. TA1 TaxID=2234087 RepID=UPI001231A052|nr:molybdenum cofactor guanylyltransferase [Thermodesulfobacterium sp. TA1]QER41328.1 molybdenum cofactor guanylyltransferase [Thermodesulfobacterium sp. TA1]